MQFYTKMIGIKWIDKVMGLEYDETKEMFVENKTKRISEAPKTVGPGDKGILQILQYLQHIIKEAEYSR